jgi:hypothetical protein
MSTVGFWLVVRRLSDSELRAQEASRQVFELMSSAEAAPALSPDYVSYLRPLQTFLRLLSRCAPETTDSSILTR